MGIAFNDIMKKFYDDESLGIKSEDAPANSVASDGVSLPADALMVKKKKPYDARTREAKHFYKRMSELRQKRESRLAQQVQENTINREHEYLLAEDNMDVLSNIVKNKQAKSIKFSDGVMKVDLYTASAITKVYDAVNSSNKDKMKTMLNGNKTQFMKIADFALSKVS